MAPVPTSPSMAPAAGPSSMADGSAARWSKHCVVVGLGMVGISFIEKLIKQDIEGGRDEWRITVVGEEPHIAYNRVGLTQYFANRSVEALHLNPLEWYSSHSLGKLVYHTHDPVVAVDGELKQVRTSKGLKLDYDVCVLATGSDAALPPYVSRDRFKRTAGAFVYRNIADLDSMISYADSRKIRRAAVVGGGLLGLEAAKALLDLETVEQAVIVERNQWVLSRQLDGEGGRLVLDKVRGLGVEVLLQARVRDLIVNNAEEDSEGKERLTGIMLEGGNEADMPYDLDMIVFAVGITPRDDLAAASGLERAPRGGFAVDAHLRTNLPDVYAIGECGSLNGETWGLIAPGVEMADVLAFNLTEGPHHVNLRTMISPDLSCKLKLMGVDVASFGDFFADRGKFTRPLPGPKGPRAKKESGPPTAASVKSLTYRDPFSDVYKKYIFTADGKYLVGGMMVGDVKDYVKLVGLCNKQKELEVPPAEFIVGSKKEGEDEGDDLDDDAQICSCHNVTKGDVIKKVKEGCRSFGEIKSCTKLATGCGGCAPLGTSIFNKAMKDVGAEVSNHVCPNFAYSRPDLYTVIKVKKLKSFSEIMRTIGVKPDSLGCEVCRPAVGSILSSLYNDFIMKPQLRQTQDTNDRYLANMQRDGTYSVVPRLPAGEVTPEQLVVLGQVAAEFKLYSKITGGQRIDLFGAKKQDLPAIWTKLYQAGFESGHAYGKSLRTIKSCVGSTWCRYGLGDSVGFAAEIENRYKSIRAPHKFKGGVSGCVRECAEAQSKDIGCIATTKGWNVYVAGNGGAKPRHADLIVTDVPKAKAMRIMDRFLMLYIRLADKLQRTARWVEAYPGGLPAIKKVIVDDSLGICADLDAEMDALVGSYHDEWAEVVKRPETWRKFRQFVNTDETLEASERVPARAQFHPALWSDESSPLKFSRSDVMSSAKWEWKAVCRLDDLDITPDAPSSVAIKYGDVQIAIFNIPGKGLRASQAMCPHRRAFVLQDGLIGETPDGKEYVSCPLHKRNYGLSAKHDEGGGACFTDADFSIMTFEAKEEDGNVLLRLPDTDALDAVLSTEKWLLRKAREEADSLVGGDASEAAKRVEIAPMTKASLAQPPAQCDEHFKGAAESSDDAATRKHKKVSCGDSVPGSELDW